MESNKEWRTKQAERIIRALWLNAEFFSDVTLQVKSTIRDGDYRTVGVSWLPDPRPGHYKSLELQVRNGSRVEVIVVQEGQLLPDQFFNQPEALRSEPQVRQSGEHSRDPNLRRLRPGIKVDAYELIDRLGRGYSAEVWKAKLTRPIPGVEVQQGDEVAIKFYNPSMLQGMETMRIQREFGIASELIHENLARVFDLVLSPNRQFHAFMVMEYVPGVTLKKHIEQNGQLGKDETIQIARQLFGALHELHSQSAIHRDVKAANIILYNFATGRPSVKLVDLGIVSMKQEDKFTNASMFLGSKHSASLEQLSGEEIDETADIYGAGSVLFHCLTGVAMYHGVGPEVAIARKMLSNPERLEDSTGDLLKEFVNRCISVKAKDRPRTAKECLEEIGRLGLVGEAATKIPPILIGKWNHEWDVGFAKSALVTISADGEYVADGPFQAKFKLTNAKFSEGEREIRFDLIKADGAKDSTQVLRVENHDLLNGYVEGSRENARRYTRL